MVSVYRLPVRFNLIFKADGICCIRIGDHPVTIVHREGVEVRMSMEQVIQNSESILLLLSRFCVDGNTGSVLKHCEGYLVVGIVPKRFGNAVMIDTDNGLPLRFGRKFIRHSWFAGRRLSGRAGLPAPEHQQCRYCQQNQNYDKYLHLFSANG